MIEAALGILVLIAAAALAAGIGAAILPLPLFGPGSLAALAVLGTTLFLHALFRIRRERLKGETYWLRTGALMTLTAGAALVLAVVVPGAFAPMGLIKIGGFPLGYYAAAQGALIGLVALSFLFDRKQDRIDIEEAIAAGERGRG